MSQREEHLNLLYYGDNLDVLRRHVDDESVDLVYLDPPFNSNTPYNVLFAEHGTRPAGRVDLPDFRVTPSEKRAFQRAADRIGLGLSSWIRLIARERSAKKTK